MQLVKTFRITEVHGTRISNVPFRFILEGIDDKRFEAKNELVMDQETCDRHGIVPSLQLVNASMQCTLTPRTLKRREVPGMDPSEATLADMGDLQMDEVLIDELVKCGSWRQVPFSSLDKLTEHVTHSLCVKSRSGSGGSMSVVNCPLYTLVVSLTEDEFQQCTQLPQGTVFGVKFALVPPAQY